MPLQALDSDNSAILDSFGEMGTLSVDEFSELDWSALGAWSVLKPLQDKRLLQQFGLQWHVYAGGRALRKWRARASEGLRSTGVRPGHDA